MRMLERFLRPAYPPLPPDMPLPPIPEHEPRYHEAASRAANASARVQLAERAVVAAELESLERDDPHEPSDWRDHMERSQPS